MSRLPGLPGRGDRVRLVHIGDPHTRLTPGTEGTVSFIDGLCTIHVHWDDGSHLSLVPDQDDWESCN